MTVKRLSKKFLQFTAFILGGILILMTAFHFWFINHAEQLVEDMVSSQSKGGLKLKVEKFKFNWFSYKMELRKANFYSTDTSAATSYQFSVPRIKIRVKEIFPLVFEKKILIDSLHLLNPDIKVIRLRSLKDTSANADTSLSLPEEMGRIYNSIQDALKVLKVDRFQIDHGKFSLINKIRPEEPPVVITNINFHLDNLQVDTTQPAGRQKILFSDNVALHTSNQNILFPDGRHRLIFRNFRINILNRFVEFDSCTVIATKGDSASNSFQVFFDKLQMTNIDFTALYHNEIIKADSVYCINPRFRLDVDLGERTGPAKSPPKLDELIRQLTGNMQLAFVIVENAAFDINTMRAGKPSSFTSDNNNFELQGLQIQKNGTKPLTVEKFVMAIRNYENFLRDSSYSIQFDSILINDNRISLSNFRYQELENNKVVNNLSMPQFELQGLSWDELVFDQQLKAKKVTLYRPVINYTIVQKQYHTKDIFQTLAGIGNFMQLENLNINDGQVNLFFKNDIQLKLEHADIAVLGKRLVDSRQLKNIQNSVTALYFKKGTFKMGELTANLSDVIFSGSPHNYLHAGTLQVKNKNELDINASDVSIRSMIINDDIRHTAISGINWNQADIKLFAFPQSNKINSSVFLLKDIKGTNTNLVADDGKKRLSLFLQDIKADKLATSVGNNLHVSGLLAAGNNLTLTDSTRQLEIKRFRIADHQPSSFENIFYTSYSNSDSINAGIPKLEMTPDINGIIDGKINAEAVHITNPSVRIRLAKSTGVENSVIENNWPETKIGKLSIEQPVLEFIKATDKGTMKLNWKGNGNVFALTGLAITNRPSANFSIEKLQLSLHNFLYTTAKGRKINTGDGKLEMALNKLYLLRNDAGAWDWNGIINHLEAKQIVVDSLGKKAGKLKIENAQLNNLAISSANLLNLREILRNNTSFRLQHVTASYHTDENQFNWYNTGYDKTTRLFTTDSFSYRPATDQASFIANSTYQIDYLVAKTGAITMGPFDIDRYAKDSVLDMGVITIDNGFLTNFRDKRLPRKPGIVRLLPANLVKSIPVRILVDTLKLKNTHIEYEELNEKNGAAGKINVEKLNGRITHFRNYNLSGKDSLHINATAYLENKLFTKLNFKESYTDSLGGFTMIVKMDSADLTMLNPILKPLTSVELKSGRLDSMIMRVVGREALAFGEMKMIYSDLKVRAIVNEEKKRSFMRGIITVFANSLVKNNNTKRTGTVFFERLRDRSAINYLVKITLSGVSSSIGIKKSDKLARKNKNHLINRQIPLANPE